MSIPIPDIILYGLLPGIGQLLTRSEYYNGSLDSPYLLIFSLIPIPFLEFIPIIMMATNAVKINPNNNSTFTFDKYMLFPILIKIIGTLLISDNYKSNNAILNITLILSILTLFINQRKQTCTDITLKSTGKIIIDTIICYSVTALVIIIMQYIPKVNSIFKQFGKNTECLIWSYIFIVVYNYINLFNKIDKDAYCNTPWTGKISDTYGLMLAILYLGYLFNNYFYK